VDTALLQTLYGLNYTTIRHNTEGVSHEESLIQPQPAGNCMNWVLGHILATRNLIFKCLKEKPVWNPEVAAIYERGSRALQEPDRAVPLAEILVDLERSQERLLARLAAVTPEELAVSSGLGDRDVGQALSFLQFHETYHAGQIGLLRRMAGKEGAIP
jgi:uncharacterized damage-inducible protein DinB